MPIRNVVRSRSENQSYFDRTQHDTHALVCLPEPVEGFKDKRSAIHMIICFLIVLFFPGVFTSCDLPHQPGPMPTEIVETEFEPGLNILGVLRADDQAGTSFININRALTTEEIYSEIIENFSPQVDFIKVRSHRTGTEYVFQSPEDTSDWGSYRDSTLLALPGDVYDLEIQAPGFPTLTGTTQIPHQPQLVPNSISVEPGKTVFKIQHLVTTYEYKLYLIFSEAVLEKVVKPSTGTVIDVDWRFNQNLGSPLLLMLTSLDENLTRYGNSPISFIPNTYHQDGSTVEGGYGCFGSVAVTLIDL